MKKYVMIANDLRKQILAGVYAANSQLPFEKEMCLHYEASKMTVKKALDQLVSEGLIVKRRGAGTFVKDLSPSTLQRLSLANQFRGTTALYPGEVVASQILTLETIPCPEEVQEKLNLPATSLVYHLYRARTVGGQPHVLERMYLPVDVVPNLTQQRAAGSIYDYLETELGLKIQSAHRQITVRPVTAAEAAYLALAPGEPVAVAAQIGYLHSGVAFEYSLSVHPWQTFSVEMLLSRD